MSIIYLEGIDGSGKSTAFHHLSKEYINVYFHSFPYYEEARNIIVNEKMKNSPDWDIVMSTFFLDNLAAQKSFDRKGYPTILCDRFWPSTLAYNRGKVSDSVFAGLTKMITDIEQVPDTIIYLDIEPRTGIQRVVDSVGGEVKEENVYFLEQVKENYASILAGYKVLGTRIVTIDVNTMDQQELVPLIKKII